MVQIDINNLNNCFNFHICPPPPPSVHPCVSIPAGASNVKRSKVKLHAVYLVSILGIGPTAEELTFIFKITWSEFQRPSQTAPAKAKPRCVYSILKSHGQSSRGQARLLPPRRSQAAYTQF